MHTRQAHAQRHVYKVQVRSKGFQKGEKGFKLTNICDHISCISEKVGLSGGKQDIYSKEDKPRQAQEYYGVPMLRSLGRGGGILLMRKFRKDACGCRIVVLWGCSTAEIWGSDSRLVFLLHNQFAVWIPFYTTLNMHCSLDPAKNLSSFPPPPIIFHVFFTCSHT